MEAALRGGSFLTVLLLMAAWETAAARRERCYPRSMRWVGNLGIAGINTAIVRLALPVLPVGLAQLASERGWGLLNVLAAPPPLAFIASLLALDLAIYLQHLSFHFVPALWRVHRVHHTDLELDVSTGLRFHPLEILLSIGIKLTVVGVLGPPAVAVLVFEILLNATSMFTHGNVRIRPPVERVLRQIIVTPDMHRIHHSVHRDETNSNFGFNLSCWDRLFGTYRDQPREGHEGMTLGIAECRTPAELRLCHMLLQPLRRAAKTGSMLALLILSLAVAQPALAQGFDPGKVDWEALSRIPMQDSFIRQFNDNCASCHGEDLRGTTLGTPLVGVPLRHGDTVRQIAESIAKGFPQAGMPAWSQTMDAARIWNLALYVAEQRQGTTILDKRDHIPLAIPQGTVRSERHSFRIRTIATGLDPMPFSIAPLPEGRILLSERMRGLSIIGRDGRKSAPIRGTPPVFADSSLFLGQVQGLGWMLDVALHPQYRRNGWIYIHHTDRCSDCNELSRRSKRPVSMNRLIRGRIRNGEWVDQQIIWQADYAAYTNTSDLAAGGRIAFDDRGYVYISVGIKGALDIIGVQDLSLPYGKILRLHDDGRVPKDNPFVANPQALPAIWTYGHRSVQGLEFDRRTGELWSTEMGPRGGDEVNRLLPGRNYGWPVVTSGVNYDGRPVDAAAKLKIQLDPRDTELPVVDMTPSPGISSFVFYSGREFPKWRGSIIVGTLRATDLLRMEIADGKVVHTETLLRDLARFRDIALGPKGELYLLLENAAGSQIVRLVPAE